MSYEVDVGDIGSFTLSVGWFVTMWAPNSGEFAPGQWFRLAPQLNRDNSPGVNISIADTASSGRYGESIWIDNNGNQNAAMTVINTGNGTADLTINWLSTPSHF
jgi:hypothetical protein